MTKARRSPKRASVAPATAMCHPKAMAVAIPFTVVSRRYGASNAPTAGEAATAIVGPLLPAMAARSYCPEERG